MPLQTTETPEQKSEKLNESIATAVAIKDGSVWRVQRKPELVGKGPPGYIVKLEGDMGKQIMTGASPTPFEKDLAFMADMMNKCCTTFPRLFVLAGDSRAHFFKDMDTYGEPFKLHISATDIQALSEKAGAFYIMPELAKLTPLDGLDLLGRNFNSRKVPLPAKSLPSYLKTRTPATLLAVGAALRAANHPAAFTELGRIFAGDCFNHNTDRVVIGRYSTNKMGPNEPLTAYSPVDIANGGNIFIIPQAGSKTGKNTFCGIDFVYPMTFGPPSNPIQDEWMGYVLKEGRKDLLEQVSREYFDTFKDAADICMQVVDDGNGGATFTANAANTINANLYDDFRKGVKTGRHAIEKFVKDALKANSPNLPAKLKDRAVALGWSK